MGSALRRTLCGLALLGAAAGCRTAEPGVTASAPAEKPPAAAVWTLQFSDPFERAALGPDWQVISGDWRIEHGMLIGGPGEGASEIACTKKFPGCQRLEYDARADDPQPCDLSGLLGIGEAGSESGYFFGFGSEWNVHSKLVIRGAEIKDWPKVITPGKVHHVVCERDGKTLRNVVDGEVVMTYTDESPLTGEGHDKVGFYIFSTGKIGNVKVYTKPEN